MRSKAETQSEEAEKTVRGIRRAPGSVIRLYRYGFGTLPGIAHPDGFAARDSPGSKNPDSAAGLGRRFLSRTLGLRCKLRAHQPAQKAGKASLFRCRADGKLPPFRIRKNQTDRFSSISRHSAPSAAC
jgi:hypothetical protein